MYISSISEVATSSGWHFCYISIVCLFEPSLLSLYLISTMVVGYPIRENNKCKNVYYFFKPTSNFNWLKMPCKENSVFLFMFILKSLWERFIFHRFYFVLISKIITITKIKMEWNQHDKYILTKQRNPWCIGRGSGDGSLSIKPIFEKKVEHNLFLRLNTLHSDICSG